MAELEWYSEPGDDETLIARVTQPRNGRTRYHVVRPIDLTRLPSVLNRYGRDLGDVGWAFVEHQNDEFDNGFAFGVYSSREAAKAAADEFENGPPTDPSALLQLIEWAKEAGEQELADRCQAQYDANHKRGPGG
jgi:hypothetical protein